MKLLIADTYNAAVKSYDGSEVTTLLSDELLFPTAVAVDAAGKVYVCDAQSNTVGLWSEGVFTRIISGLNIPYGLAVAPRGDIYVADTRAGLVKQYRGRVLVRSIGDVSLPMDIAVDRGGTLYIADTRNRVIKMVTGNDCTVVAGGDRNLPWYHLEYPQSVDVGPDGVVYFSETDADTIWAWDGEAAHRVLDHGLFRPHAIAVHERQLFISDQQGIKWSDGNVVETIIGFPDVCGPQGICISV